MSRNGTPEFRLEWMLAGVLHYGSWLASATIAAGLAWSMADGRVGLHSAAVAAGMRVVTAGIALFILLPVLRVALMLVVFLQERDYRFSAIAALVLAILFVGFAIGLHVA